MNMGKLYTEEYNRNKRSGRYKIRTQTQRKDKQADDSCEVTNSTGLMRISRTKHNTRERERERERGERE